MQFSDKKLNASVVPKISKIRVNGIYNLLHSIDAFMVKGWSNSFWILFCSPENFQEYHVVLTSDNHILQTSGHRWVLRFSLWRHLRPIWPCKNVSSTWNQTGVAERVCVFKTAVEYWLTPCSDGSSYFSQHVQAWFVFQQQVELDENLNLISAVWRYTGRRISPTVHSAVCQNNHFPWIFGWYHPMVISSPPPTASPGRFKIWSF